jgi:hypothetical protein
MMNGMFYNQKSNNTQKIMKSINGKKFLVMIQKLV